MKNTANQIDVTTHAATTANIGSQPAIYCGTYSKYNNGSIAGGWIDLTEVADEDEFYAVCTALHADEQDPEFMFQDFQGFPRRFYGESGLDGLIWEYIEMYKELNDDQIEALNSYIDNGTDMADFQEAYQGNFKSEEDFAYDLCEGTDMLSEVPESIKCYFDYERFARDLFMSDYWMDSHGNVFRNM